MIAEQPKDLPQTTHGTPKSYPSHPLPANILLRAATSADCTAIADCFYTSFYPSHPFWTHEWPASVIHPWFAETFRMGLEDDPSMRTFVAVDTSVVEEGRVEDRLVIDGVGISKGKNVEDGRVVAFARWRVPQVPDRLDEMWPDLPEEKLDMSVLGPFFGGMHHNRAELLNGRPHWFLQLLGTQTSYQGLGIGQAFVNWGCEHADVEDLEVYIDASEMGGPFYSKHFGCVPRKKIDIPSKPETFGDFNYNSQVRSKKSERTA